MHRLPPSEANAGVAELVDALDLGSSGETRGGSSPLARTFGGPGAGPAYLRRVRLTRPEARGRHQIPVKARCRLRASMTADRNWAASARVSNSR
jgi:hypothetical protein